MKAIISFVLVLVIAVIITAAVAQQQVKAYTMTKIQSDCVLNAVNNAIKSVTGNPNNPWNPLLGPAAHTAIVVCLTK
jgi:hypothetical protein